jgi:hypothetical protein
MLPEEAAAEDAATLQNGHEVVGLVNAMLAAQKGDARRTCAAPLTFSRVLLQHDQIGLIALAEQMRDCADEIEHDVWKER